MNKYRIEYAIFSKIARFKQCKSCFRCTEVGNYSGGWWDISKKPRKGKRVSCCSACSPDIRGDMNHKACEWYEPRWYWNAGQKWRRFSYVAGRIWIENVRMKIGALRKPVALEWVDGLTVTGELNPKSDPKCPHCGEMPYSLKQCQFCGQRFVEVDNENTMQR